jgi:hypothetical protein
MFYWHHGNINWESATLDRFLAIRPKRDHPRRWVPSGTFHVCIQFSPELCFILDTHTHLVIDKNAGLAMGNQTPCTN